MQENQGQVNGNVTSNSIDSAIESVFGGKSIPDVNVEGNRPPVQDQTEADERNAEFRAKKHKEERDQLASKLSEKDQMIANLQGQMDALTKLVKPEVVEPEVDPTEHMTQTESALYNGIKQLEAKLQELAGNLNGVQSKVVSKEHEQEENAFYEAYELKTPESREEAKELVKGYVKDDPELLKGLLSGKFKIGKIYEYALLQSGKPIFKNATQDPTKVFGNGRPESTPVNGSNSKPNVLEEAKKVLKDKDSSEKKKAVDVGIGVIVDELLSQMMN